MVSYGCDWYLGFIKRLIITDMHQKTSSASLKTADSTLLKRAAVASILTALLLLFAKVFAWTLSDSTSVLSSMIDSLMDIAASGINLIAIRYALMPADEDHQFGHGKAEGIAALIQSAFILGTAVLLLLQVFERLLNPRPIQALEESVGVMLFSALATLLLVLYQRYVYKRTQSLAIRSDAAHYVSDILTSLVVVVALICSSFGYYWVDPLVALFIVLVLLYGVYGIVRAALAVLMDEALDNATETQIRNIVLGCAGVKGLHNLQTRQAGNGEFIQLHLELDGQQSLEQAHSITIAVEALVQAAFPRARIIIHQDPV